MTTEIDTIVALSHEFGTPEYVKGGGGNTSFKNDTTLWIKPSGTTLGALTAEAMVEIDRAKLRGLYGWEPPNDVQAREASVKEQMMAAVRPGSKGRPSVETPMHDCLTATFVVHTHPTLVNGMTCGQGGAATCAELFPDALWIPYVHPGYVLSKQVHDDVAEYAGERGRQPDEIFLENHGLVVAGETAEEIRERHAVILQKIEEVYASNRLSTTLAQEPAPDRSASDRLSDVLESIPALKGSYVHAAGKFSVAAGPISPDHIVYSKSYALKAEPTATSLAEFQADHGYYPQVVECEAGVFGIGATESKARLAVELAEDGALIEQLVPAFGGIRYLDDASRDFIDNWEVEL